MVAGCQPFKTGPRAWNINYLRTKTALLLSRLGVEPLSPPAIRGILVISSLKNSLCLEFFYMSTFYFQLGTISHVSLITTQYQNRLFGKLGDKPVYLKPKAVPIRTNACVLQCILFSKSSLTNLLNHNSMKIGTRGSKNKLIPRTKFFLR